MVSGEERRRQLLSRRGHPTACAWTGGLRSVRDHGRRQTLRSALTAAHISFPDHVLSTATPRRTQRWQLVPNHRIDQKVKGKPTWSVNTSFDIMRDSWRRSRSRRRANSRRGKHHGGTALRQRWLHLVGEQPPTVRPSAPMARSPWRVRHVSERELTAPGRLALDLLVDPVIGDQLQRASFERRGAEHMVGERNMRRRESAAQLVPAAVVANRSEAAWSTRTPLGWAASR